MPLLSRLIPQSFKNTFFHLPKALLATLIYRYPARSLTVVGITGSDGKTTTTHLTYHILNSCGYKVAMVSTVAAKIGTNQIDTGFHVTSPEPFLLQKLLRQIVDSGFTHVVLECTSHGLDQHRLFGSNIQIGVLTNITHEHLDYHGNYANYLAAKSKLFTHAKWAILNKDDKSFHLVRSLIPKSVKVISYGIASKATITAKNIRSLTTSSAFSVTWGSQKVEVQLPLPGSYNIQNCLGALAASGVCGVKLPQAASSLGTFPPVVGRLNQVHSRPAIYIDFAHTPNALEQVLNLLRSQLDKGSRLIAVFGCAGQRDYQKRPLMGRISARLAHISIFTAEDPRSEDVNQIIESMVQGARKTRSKEISSPLSTHDYQLPTNNSHIFIRQPDRALAIKLAIQISRPQDVIVITGKGHEKSMNFGQGEVPWSDFDIVSQSLS